MSPSVSTGAPQPGDSSNDDNESDMVCLHFVAVRMKKQPRPNELMPLPRGLNAHFNASPRATKMAIADSVSDFQQALHGFPTTYTLLRYCSIFEAGIHVIILISKPTYQNGELEQARHTRYTLL